jgi:hypothetical protein
MSPVDVLRYILGLATPGNNQLGDRGLQGVESFFVSLGKFLDGIHQGKPVRRDEPSQYQVGWLLNVFALYQDNPRILRDVTILSAAVTQCSVLNKLNI